MIIRLAVFLSTLWFTSSNTTLIAPTTVFGELVPTPGASDSLRAFPGAEGWGALALNACRDLTVTVHQVTNTNSSGAGSLRTAIEATTNGAFDFIIFRTGGTLDVTPAALPASADCTYFAGQTAPGGGYQIKRPGAGNSLLTFKHVHDMVVRYLRLRHGLDTITTGGGPCGSGDAIRGTSTSNIKSTNRIVVDHVTAAWTLDSHMGVWKQGTTGPDVREISLQHNLMHEALINHSTSYSSGGSHVCASGSTTAYLQVYDLSYHHNLNAHNLIRNPNVLGHNGLFTKGNEVINNVVYNWGNGIGQSLCDVTLDLINNFWKRGPGTSTGSVSRWRHKLTKNSGGPVDDSSIYIDGNEWNGPVLGEQWDFIRANSGGGSVSKDHQRLTRLDQPTFPVTVLTPTQAFDTAIAHAGASRKLSCDGLWVSNRDATDDRIIQDVQDSTGIHIVTPSQVGGWPTLAAGTACTDTDGDGLPDAWELMCGADATSLTIGGDISGDGYKNMEEYVNATNGHGVDLDWTDNATNEVGFFIDRDAGSGFARYDSVAANVTIYFDASGLPGYIYKVGAHNTDGESATAGPFTIACR